MSEHRSPEQQAGQERAPQSQVELEQLAAERLSKLKPGVEREGRRHEAVEAAREQLKQAEQVKPAVEATPKAEPVNQGILTKAANYRQTMVSLRHRMKPASRTFSKFIHSPVVEQTSEIAGKTVFRPSVTLGATTTAVLLVGFIYLYARQHGFLLKGSEMWITLIAGAFIGLIIEGITNLIRRRKA